MYTLNRQKWTQLKKVLKETNTYMAANRPSTSQQLCGYLTGTVMSLLYYAVSAVYQLILWSRGLVHRLTTWHTFCLGFMVCVRQNVVLYCSILQHTCCL